MSLNTSGGSGREGGGPRTGASLLAPSKFSSNFLSGNSSSASTTSTAATTTNATAGSGSTAPRVAPEPARSSSSFPGFKASKLSGITQTLFSSETKKEPTATASSNLWATKDEAKAAPPAVEKPKPVFVPLDENAGKETDKENTKISPVKRSPEKSEDDSGASAKRVRLESAPPPVSASPTAPASVPAPSPAASPVKPGPEAEAKPSQSLSPRSSEAANFVFGQNLAERADNFSTGFVFGQNLTERAENFSPEPAEAEPDKATLSPVAAAPISDPKSPPKSLTESAAAYYETHAAPKRKYDEVVVVTGEEGEVNVVQMSAKLHWFDKATSNWHERGRGTLRLNDIAEPNSKTSSPPMSSRLVMRTAGSLRVVLNTKLYRGMPVECPTEKNLRLTGMDDVGVLRVFLVTGAAKDISNMFAALQFRLKAIEKACQNEGQGSESDSDEEDDGDGPCNNIKVPRLK